MKFLRNPLVVALLATFAGIYSVWTALGSRGPRFSRAAPAPPAASVPSTPAPVPSTPQIPIADPLPPSRPIDHPAIAALSARWIESPRRDPFRLDRTQAESPSGPPAAQLLFLRAIWRQTGSQLAIINDQILREGEKLQGFAIETIEAEAVWVRGTNGRERLTFPMSTTISIPSSEHVTTALDDGPARQGTISANLPLAPTP